MNWRHWVEKAGIDYFIIAATDAPTSARLAEQGDPCFERIDEESQKLGGCCSWSWWVLIAMLGAGPVSRWPACCSSRAGQHPCYPGLQRGQEASLGVASDDLDLLPHKLPPPRSFPAPTGLGWVQEGCHSARFNLPPHMLPVSFSAHSPHPCRPGVGAGGLAPHDLEQSVLAGRPDRLGVQPGDIGCDAAHSALGSAAAAHCAWRRCRAPCELTAAALHGWPLHSWPEVRFVRSLDSAAASRQQCMPSCRAQSGCSGGRRSLPMCGAISSRDAPPPPPRPPFCPPQTWMWRGSKIPCRCSRSTRMPVGGMGGRAGWRVGRRACVQYQAPWAACDAWTTCAFSPAV